MNGPTDEEQQALTAAVRERIERRQSAEPDRPAPSLIDIDRNNVRAIMHIHGVATVLRWVAEAAEEKA